MEKQSKKLTFVLQLVVILLFMAILCFPMAMMLIDGPDETEVESEAATNLVDFTYESYFTGEFHSAFEAWFSHHYPMRSSVVATFKDMLYRLEMSKPAIAVMNVMTSFGSTYSPYGDQPLPPAEEPVEGGVDPMAIYTDPNNIYAEINIKQMSEEPVEPAGFKGSSAVYIGKSGYLYESGYIDEYYGFGDLYQNMSDEGIAETVKRLEYIQKELERRYGITMIYVLSSSKASEYAEYIPDHYKNRYIIDPNYVRPVDRLRTYLAESSVNYLDSSMYYKEIGLKVTFPKTGIHWNHLASFETTAELLRMYVDISGNEDVKLLDIAGIISSDTPIATGGNSDVDVYNILYGTLGDVEGKIMDDQYYAPDVVVSNEEAPTINVFVQGGSFTSDIVNYMTKYHVANARRIYYNGDRNFDNWGSHSPWEEGIMIWEEALKGVDLLIFEATEATIRGQHVTDGDWHAASLNGYIGHNAVYDSLYEFLKATE